MSEVQKIVPNPELYKLHEDIMQVINKCGDEHEISLAAALGTLELIKLTLIGENR